MYEHRVYYGHANKFLTHGTGKDDLCMVIYLYPTKDSLLDNFFSKSSGKTESGHPIGMFFSNAAKKGTFVIKLDLHFVF